MIVKPLLALAASLTLGMAPPLDLDEPDNIPYNAVVRLKCGGGYGTAFWVAPNILYTAEHVTEHAPCSIAGQPVEILHEDEAKDFAIVRGPTNRARFRVRCDGYAPGQVSWAIGFPGGKYRHTARLHAEHRVAMDVQVVPNRGLYKFSGQVFPGMSGGPIVDSSGVVVGITNRGTPDGFFPVPPQTLSRELTLTEACK